MVKGIKDLFSGLHIIVYMLMIFAGSLGYLYLITKDMLVSVIVGIFTMFFAFYHSVYLTKKVEHEQYLLKELQRYTTSMTFYLQSGYNVFQALNRSRHKLDEKVRQDIEKTMMKLQKEAVLDTSHFEKYNFPSLDIFHEILKIKYEKGGDTKELFTRVNESINFELVKRDELYRRKQYLKRRILIMMGITLAIPLVLVFFTSDIYNQFLEIGAFATLLGVGLFLANNISLFFLQRAVNDISI